ncbi:MAG: beta-galactosidase [Phycisphaerae bacterium]|nr:beta-galactosidase [Phycisphaerae bacterium]
MSSYMHFIRQNIVAITLTLFLLIPCSLCAAKVQVQEEKEAGQTRLVLENDYLRVVIVPESGGRTFSLVDKKTGWDHSAKTDSGLGLFWEMLWQQPSTYRNDWAGKPYIFSVSSKKDSASVTLERVGTTGSLQYLTLRKTYTLRDDSAALFVKYEYVVDPNAMQDILITPRFHHGPNDGGQVVNVYFCDSKGVVEQKYDPSLPAGDHFIYNVTRSWFGWTIPSKHVAAAFDFDYKNLMCLFQWQGGFGFTLEWMFNSLKVKNGQTFETETTFLPVQGLARIDGVGNELAGCFNIDAQTLKGVQLYSCRARDVIVKVSLENLPAGESVFSKTVKQAVKVGEPVTIPLANTISKDGTYVYRCRIETTDGKQLMEFERPVTVGESSGRYVMKPQAKRIGDPEEQFRKISIANTNLKDPYSYTNTIPSNGVRWCQPYTEGKIKLLAIVDWMAARDAIELAERMDADLSMCTFAGGGRTGWTSYWGHSGGNAEMNSFLRRLLQKDYDCIVVGGLSYTGVSPDNLAGISEKVKGGTGFVCVMPTNVPEEYAGLFPAKLTNIRWSEMEKLPVSVVVSPAKNLRFLKSLPFEALPGIQTIPNSASGDVLATAGENPLVCTGLDGKGRTALFSWRPSGGLTPYINAAYAYPYHEYFFSMLIKAVRWASHREPSIVLNNLQWTNSQLTADVNSLRKGNSQEVVFDVTLKHESNTLLKHFTYPTKLHSRKNQIAIPVDVNLPDGTSYADVRLLVGNKVADFGSTAIKHTGPDRIESLTVKDDIYPSGQAIPLKVKTACKDKDVKLLVELREKNGRSIARQEQAIPEATTNLSISLTPVAIYDHAGTLQVSLLKNETLLARKKQDLLLRPEHLKTRTWDAYRITLGYPTRRSTAGFPGYLCDMRTATLKKMGVDSMLFGVNYARDEQCRFHYSTGFDVVATSFARINKRITPGYKHECFDYQSGRKRAFETTRRNYAKTGDKKYLKRNPCLENPKYRKDFRKGVTQLLEQLQKWRPVVYDIGDESSYTRHTKQIDFDFSKSSLIGFRKWLKGEYKTLADLNRTWGSKFKSWDKVIPPTSKETRKSGRYAAWADHRSYNEFVYAGFLKYIIEILKDVDPQAAASISGTQQPKAYGGWDWSLAMPLFDTLNAYTHGGLTPIYRSFNHVPLMSWQGYGSDFDGLNSKVWYNAFNGHYGTAIYDENVVLNPDMSLTQSGRDMARIFRPLRRGAGTLLQSTRRLKPVIGIHYSQPSVHAAWIDQGEKKFVQARIGWLTALEDNGFTYEFISYGDIEKGKLKEKGYNALVLPMSAALSDKEVQGITSYVKDGGVLLADDLPGTYDEHCAPKPRPVIKKLFDENKNAVLVGTSLCDYTHEITGKRNPQLVSQMKVIFNSLALPHLQRLVAVPETGMQRFTFHLGKRGWLVGMIGENDDEASLPDFGKLYFYDVIREKPIALNTVQIKANQPILLAVLPYDPGELLVNVKRTADPDRVEITAGFDGTQDGDMHVFRFDVTDAQGKVVPMYSKVIPAPGGKTMHTFCPALNESKAKWTITVTDVVTGRRVSQTSPPLSRGVQ